MRIGLLGALEVHDANDASVEVAGAKLRTLLAVLALHAGRVVPVDQLADTIWGEDPPPGVRNSLQGLASKLRRALGSTEIVAMRGGGYALEVPADAVDVHRYEQLVAEGRSAVAAGDPARAVALFTSADSLWRGNALVDFAYDDFALPFISRLSELRLAVIEERLDIELELGRHQSAVVELEALVVEHPLRERPRGLLMVALYRAGRQADALRVFQEGRTVLRDELGLEPGPELRRLEAAVLAQDESLDARPSPRLHAGPRVEHRATIPESLTPLVGRDEELADVMQLAAEHRFITLVGPGGVGKTRLALEVARAEAGNLANGGCLVELAHVGDPSGVREAIALALDVPDPTSLAPTIGDREVLVVLDNCEHVIDTAAEVAEDLLQRCPRLRLLATSREALRVGGETVWPVPPLPAADATQLFTMRAQAAGAHLEVNDELVSVIAGICARLDGLPLAIELAAARTRAIPLAQISTRLNDRFRLLTGGSRTALPRQQTMRAVVDWSYELLFADEQRVFERLSVFADGCDRAAAEAVCADDDLAADDLDDIIHALIDKSLVVAQRSGDELRFTQLQTLAHYGQEKLAARGDAERIRHAMAAHYAQLCARSAAAYMGEEQRLWLTTVDRERDNIRAALEWAVANDDAETALTIAGGASWPHWLAGTVAEGTRWLDDAFACTSEADEHTRALALTGRALLGIAAGATTPADADLETALSIFRAHDDVPAMALTGSFYAEAAAGRDDIDEARRRRVQMLDLYGGVPQTPFVRAAIAFSRGKLAVLDGDIAQAERDYRAAAAGFDEIDRPVMLSICLGIVADFDERAGNYADAVTALEDAVEISDTLGLKGFMGTLLARLAWALLCNGDAASAARVNERALDVAQRLHHVPARFRALTAAAVLHQIDHNDRAAAAAATEALGCYLVGGPRRFGNRIDPRRDVLAGEAVCCAVLAVIAGDEGDGIRAAQLLGQAARLQSDAGAETPAFQRDDIERARDAAITLLGDAGFTAAFEQGRRSDLGELVTPTP
jgi:predicted ATPase/DNA-binding SARP family transcriptional activator